MNRVELALQNAPIVAILRGLGPEEAVPLARALYQGGIGCIEVTFPSPGSLTSLAAIAKEMPDVVPGMGTVMTPEEVDQAVAAGAEFIVSPNTDPLVIRRTKELGKISMPGAMTPSEAVVAARAGADVIKIFPASCVSPNFFREMRGPLPQYKFMGTGGITVENADTFIKAGAYAIGMGGALVDKALIAARNFEQIEANARQLVARVKAAR